MGPVPSRGVENTRDSVVSYDGHEQVRYRNKVSLSTTHGVCVKSRFFEVVHGKTLGSGVLLTENGTPGCRDVEV